MKDYLQLRKEYKEFIYEKFEIIDLNDNYKIIYTFVIPNLETFNPSFEINKKYLTKIDNFSKYLIFHIGLVELISYWKVCCPKNVIIKAGYINEEQINWFKKLYFLGLGEFFYINNIDTSIDDFMNILCDANEIKCKVDFNGNGNLIPIGGGKDSVVSLELLSKNRENNNCFILNPKEVTLECAKIGGYDNNSTITLKRFLDKKLIKLNNQGFLNGHTPFSALLAFITYFVAYENDKQYIILSNEGSANESTVIGTNVNHQYSKTFEFENDFNNYTNKYFNISIKYFSLLRPLSELQIAMLFSKYNKYHLVFKSCNVGSKQTPWKWCCNCGKCLFVFIILSPFLYRDKLIEIFGEDLFEKTSLLSIFEELTGNAATKPFDCVGTIDEVRYAVSYTINRLMKNNQSLPFLLQYFKDNYELMELNNPILEKYSNQNNLPIEFEHILKKEVDECVSKYYKKNRK